MDRVETVKNHFEVEAKEFDKIILKTPFPIPRSLA